jgi:hypothetical protein
MSTRLCGVLNVERIDVHAAGRVGFSHISLGPPDEGPCPRPSWD